MSKSGWLIFVFVCAQLISFAQAEKKSIPATRSSTDIKIDGSLDDAAWESAPIARDFIMFEPENGDPEIEGFETEIRVLYTDNAVYIGAMMFDPHPDSVLKQLTKRDVYNENCDWLGIFINPYNDGLSDFNFWVTAAGTQSDAKTTVNGDDFSLNSVWNSSVKMNENGWVVEAEIPYIALRFPEAPVADWGLNFMRNIRRKRKQYSWNLLDLGSGNRLEYQCGLLTNMTDIDPPVRLSAMPYVSAYVDDFNGKTTYDLNAGLDLKYGINESFTLDMTVIPDFGQVAYDQQFLNLSPFENQFDENRQFFTEGTELFNIGNLLYTRRIGGAPKNIQGIDLNSSDSVEIRQGYTRLLNATKISGRTKHNLGIGFMNSLTADNFSTRIENGEETQVLTEPMTNYNVLVFDQRFNRTSSVSLVNTNVLRKGGSRDANVTALLGSFYTKSGNHLLEVSGNQSAIFEGDSIETGYRSSARLADVGGHWRWAGQAEFKTDDYNPNDLGFQRRNNAIFYQGEVGYRTTKPVGPFNKFSHDIVAWYQFLFKPYRYEETVISYNGFFLLRNFFAFGMNAAMTPNDVYNYYEPREWGRWFRGPAQRSVGGFISSDYRRKVALDANGTFFWWNRLGKQETTFRLRPRFRFGDHFFALPIFKIVDANNDYGYVPDNDPTQVHFGRRNTLTIENSIDAQYVFTPKTSLTLVLRHTYTDVDYRDFYILENDGYLTPTALAGVNDLNFNAFNIDLKYSWWFAPGSELVILYRQAVAAADNTVGQSYYQNLDGTFDSPVQNNISVRFTYFLDYNRTRNYFRNRRTEI
ncbi:MAG TPA: hypothetical protein DCX14_07405 [Flavobacteriales bacterium]|nr:hypothetical protein [Flavobacteriales bacterium]